MAHRINERNVGNWTLDGEPKRRGERPKKISRSFDKGEVEMLWYLLNKVAKNVTLDTDSDGNQNFIDNGDIVLCFERERMEDLRSLLEKFDLPTLTDKL